MDLIITIDGTGRLVIPKRLRSKYNLRKGSRLRVVDDGVSIVLEPVCEDVTLEETGGLLIIQGRLKGPVPDHRQLR